MADLSINEQLGGLMIGFSVYDALHEEWLFSVGADGITQTGIAEGEFTLIRGMFVVLIATLIAVNLAISYRLNQDAVNRAGEETIKGSFFGAIDVIRERPLQVVVMLACAIASLLITYWGLGLRQAFLLFIGFGFVNSGPLFNRLAAKMVSE